MQKPEGVKYLYNETFVETPFKDEQGTYQYKHQSIHENLRIMMEKYPGLIDSFGTQVHIDAFIEPEHLEKTFSVLANWQKEFKGLDIQITEFDVHFPPQIIDKANELTRNGGKTKLLFRRKTCRCRRRKRHDRLRGILSLPP
jgi:GH35 family endo-1,4-beta-xylanase